MQQFSDFQSAIDKFPFRGWREKRLHGLTQYTDGVCSKAEDIMNMLIFSLINIGANASEPEKVNVFKTAVMALNSLNADHDGSLIETDEREELCPLFDEIALLVGLEPKECGGGEGIATEWREW